MSAPWIEPIRAWLRSVLQPHLSAEAEVYLAKASAFSPEELGPELARASRFARSKPLGATPEQCCKAAGLRAGWNPERLQVLEALRLLMLLEREDLESDAFADGLLNIFAFADEGELRALYKSLALLPKGERFAWQAAEGCRTNVTGVFEAVATDSPYPAQHFPEVAWRSLCIKSLFLGAPLWRVHGLDDGLDSELARIALDLVEERRSAGRAIMTDLWLLVGKDGGERGLQSLMQEWKTLEPGKRGAVALALGRAGATETLKQLSGTDPSGSEADKSYLEMALAGQTEQNLWRAFA